MPVITMNNEWHIYEIIGSELHIISDYYPQGPDYLLS